MAMMTPAVWTPGYAVLMFLMGWVMMVAMMLSSAAPMILLFATVNRKQNEIGHPHVATSIFAVGYLAAWAGFSLVTLILQCGLEQSGILSPMLVGTSVVFDGVLLLAAGAYQRTPIKHACLRHCRSPLALLSTHWRRGGPWRATHGPSVRRFPRRLLLVSHRAPIF
ncbi:DUF2182 domain-containing protein [Metapseudomonas boanensis]|uniref:DUF2182 domain-containing protein n=1 Tax=Metapseudomonas boanensis TaxID=2822138 RepID=A0ABS5XHL1_9GAMM|nr:DUF2182 domain-containing protein [Pseudomonas boanensis]MBT8766763.1 DUF2182 domain-containing protein [Pseudomonas boanensis]